jgi:transposase/transposase-like protein
MRAVPLALRDGDRERLESWLRSSTIQAGLAQRTRIVLLAADGLTNVAIAARVGVSRPTVTGWRARYQRSGIGGLSDEVRSGRPRTIDHRRIVAATLKAPPKKLGVTHWSSRLLAGHLGIGDATVARAWREYGVAPWRCETFKFSTDPELVAKVTDVVGLYLAPPENAIVLCVDEKSQIQALDRTAPMLPMQPGLPERRTHDYVRHGTTTLFAALNIATGTVTARCQPRHRHQEFLRFLKQVAKAYPRRRLHIVCDNYATHKHPTVKAWLARNPRITLHFTPTSGSWLNMVEIFFGIITRQAIRRGSFRSRRSSSLRRSSSVSSKGA